MMNGATIGIIVIVAVVVFFAIRSSVKHMKGEGGCCGGGSEPIAEEKKILENPILGKKIVTIEGMHCENCTNRVKRAINRIDGVSAKLNLKKKQAVVKYEKEVEDDTLIKEIEDLGYKVVSVQ